MAIHLLSDKHIDQVLADPPLIWRVLAPDDPEVYAAASREKIGFLARLFGGRKSDPAAFALSADENEETDLDKAWHAIHYLLTRSVWEGAPPLNFLLAGGREVGEIEVGYGPARVLTAAEVRRVHQALGPIDEPLLRSRFDPAEMTRLEIYPPIWDRDPAADDTFGYCVEYFDVLKAFVARAAEKNLGLVISMV